jgi:hypothetical protein
VGVGGEVHRGHLGLKGRKRRTRTNKGQKQEQEQKILQK